MLMQQLFWDKNKSQVLPFERLTLGFGLFNMTRDICLLNTERSRYTKEMCNKLKVKLSLLSLEREEIRGEKRKSKNGKEWKKGTIGKLQMNGRRVKIEKMFSYKR